VGVLSVNMYISFQLANENHRFDHVDPLYVGVRYLELGDRQVTRPFERNCKAEETGSEFEESSISWLYFLSHFL
jgi:hypothetical protein